MFGAPQSDFQQEEALPKTGWKSRSRTCQTAKVCRVSTTACARSEILPQTHGVLHSTSTQAMLNETTTHAKPTSPHAKSMQNPCKTRFTNRVLHGICMS
ncbi:hypothetical protein Y032_0089g2241 [Ancylostoma ceylanicum]|uniref:Uncharacterized protein n=1 Tax=Ancylostoma ceylanicum TaxID=53326 RepID=A0A016TMF0_9BILA|nr:hypothetical protein Y032_0089g2241 [Ancylostoma ceylanicum]